MVKLITARYVAETLGMSLAIMAGIAQIVILALQLEVSPAPSKPKTGRERMKLICSYCGKDLNEIWQDNMSENIGTVICEDCFESPTRRNEP